MKLRGAGLVIASLACIVAQMAHAAPAVSATVLVGYWPYGVAANPVTQRAYATAYVSGDVTVIDTTTNTAVKTVPIAPGAFGIAVDAVRNRIYVGHGSSVSVIDGTTDTVVATVPVGTQVRMVAADATTGRVYAAAQVSDAVYVIDGVAATVIGVIPVVSPFGLTLNPLTNRLYVGAYATNTVSVFDMATHLPLGSVVFGERAFTLTSDPTTNTVYVVHRQSNRLSVIDGTTNAVTATIPLDVTDPQGIAIDPVRQRLFVTGFLSFTTQVIDAETRTPLATFSVGAYPHGVDVSAVTGTAYVTNVGGFDGSGGNSVSVISDSLI